MKLRAYQARRAAIVMGVALLLPAVVAGPIAAQSATGEVSATVTATEACITVEAASVAFGANPFSQNTGDAAGDETAIGTPDTSATSGASYALTNCSTAESSFLGVGSDAQNAVPDVTWALDATDFLGGICTDPDGGTNRYRMSVDTDANNDGDLTGDSGIFLSTSSATLSGGSAVAAGSALHVANRITMPCTGSDGAGDEMTAAITYTAALN